MKKILFILAVLTFGNCYAQEIGSQAPDFELINPQGKKVQLSDLRGKVVLIDRFFDSTIAYQGYGRGLDLDFIDKCSLFATQGIEPDITFYLKINMNTSNERRIMDTKDRIEKSGLEFYQKVISGFDNIAINNPKRVVTINAENNISTIHDEIMEIVNKMMVLKQN